MAQEFQIPPTWTNPILVEKDPRTGENKATFSPVWLDWFIRLAAAIPSSGSNSSSAGGNPQLVMGKPPTVPGHPALWADATATLLADGGAGFFPASISNWATSFGPDVDNTDALNSAIKEAYDGNGMLYIGEYVRADGAIAIPHDGFSNPRQKPLRIFGGVGTANGYLQGVPTKGKSVLDLRYPGTGFYTAKINTRGAGLLEIDHLTLLSGGTDNTDFISTTNTTVHIHHNQIMGNQANEGVACKQNFIRLGGDGSAPPQSVEEEAYFQGYGSKLSDNHYDRIQYCHIYGSQCNGIEVQNETVSKTCGSSDPHGAPFVFLASAGGGTPSGGGSFGLVMRSGTIEIAFYKHVIRLSAAVGCYFDGVSAYDDFSGAFESVVYCDAASSGNLLVCNWYPKVPFSGPGAPAQSFVSSNFLRVNAGPGRPDATQGAGMIFYDTTLGKPIFSNGSVWRDAAGTPV